MDRPSCNIRWLLVLFTATLIVAANCYAEAHVMHCSGAFRKTLINAGNLLGADFEVDATFSGLKPRRILSAPNLRFRWGRFVVRRPDRLLRWVGSATIVVMMVVGIGVCKPKGTV